MANAIAPNAGQRRDTSLYVGNPDPVLMNEAQGQRTLGVINEVEENSVTKKDLKALTIVALALGVCSIAITGGISGIVIGVALLVIAVWAGYKSTTVEPHIVDAKLHAWHASDFAGRLAPNERPQAPTFIQRARSVLAGIPVEELDRPRRQVQFDAAPAQRPVPAALA